MPRPVLPYYLVLAVAVSLGVGAPALAQVNSAAQERAAALFDRGVREFSEGNHELAARTFLQADDLVGSTQALVNAVTAAQRSGNPLLTTVAARRLLARKDADPRAAELGKDALVAAARYLAIVELECTPAPCQLQLNGESVAQGLHYATPGRLVVTGIDSEGRRRSREQRVERGARYRIAIKLHPSRQIPRARDVMQTQDSKDIELTRAPQTPQQRRLPRAAFFTGVAGTGGMIAATVWSGVNTLSARRAFPADYYDEAEVRRRARRTDYLLVGTAVLAGATAAIGIWWVDWGNRTKVAISVPDTSGISLVTTGRF